MLTNAVRSALSKSLIIPLAFAALAVPVSRAQANENLVVAIDLTASVAATGPDGKSEFQKNIDAVTGVLAQVPAASRVTVIGITDHSFAQPYILMSARTGADPGYFGERLSGARGQLVRTWRQRSARLDPHFRRTDILGALQFGQSDLRPGAALEQTGSRYLFRHAARYGGARPRIDQACACVRGDRASLPAASQTPWPSSFGAWSRRRRPLQSLLGKLARLMDKLLSQRGSRPPAILCNAGASHSPLITSVKESGRLISETVPGIQRDVEFGVYGTRILRRASKPRWTSINARRPPRVELNGHH